MAAALACAVLLPALASGDWITLKAGGRVTGTIIRQTPKEITIQDDRGALLTFQLKQVLEYYVHPVAPADDAKVGGEDGEANAPGEANSAKGGGSDEIVLSERAFGECTLKIPVKYELTRGRMKFDGYNGELLGLCEDQATDTMLSVSTGGLAAGTEDFNEMMAASKKFFAGEKQCTILRWERRELAGLPGVYAELEGPKAAGDRIFLFLWVQVRANEIYAANVTVPREHFLRDPDLYRGILRSFRFRPTAPKAPPPKSPPK
ncbi:MAG: hypothetical protein L0Z55_00635 [Planctomycetes bacterium]|nr:hypothetical protein [Planctomycetota bacterium]